MASKNCCAFVRVVQSNNGWTEPCGLDYGHGAHFAARSGFGFEEWINSPLMEVEPGKQLIHIEAFRIGFNPKNIGKPLYLWVYSKPKNLPSRKYLVGVIKNYSVQSSEKVQNSINNNIIIPKLREDIQKMDKLDDSKKALALEILEKKLEDLDEKKFNLLVDKKDIIILPKVEWIELPDAIFRHKRFVAYYNLNEHLQQCIKNIKI